MYIWWLKVLTKLTFEYSVCDKKLIYFRKTWNSWRFFFVSCILVYVWTVRYVNCCMANNVLYYDVLCPMFPWSLFKARLQLQSLIGNFIFYFLYCCLEFQVVLICLQSICEHINVINAQYACQSLSLSRGRADKR